MKAIIVALLLFSQISWANTPDCEPKLIPVRSIKNSGLAEARKVTIKFVGEMIFELGGLLYKFKKIGETWYSGAVVEGNDIQSDVRFFALLFGNKAAYFFGFRQLEDNIVTAPDAVALNKTIEILNSVELKNDPIEVRFYNAEGIVDGWTHLKHFAKLELPISKKGHDHSFHAGTFAIPTADLKLAAEQAQWHIDFLEWAEERFKDTNWFSPLKLTVVELMVGYKSDLSGDIPHNVASRLMQNISTHDPELDDIGEEIDAVFGSGMDAPGFLRANILDTLKQLKDLGFNIANSERPQLALALTEFIKSRQAVNAARPELTSLPKSNVTNFYNRVAERRGKIAEAVAHATKRLNLLK